MDVPGYAGRVLKIDLASGEINSEELDFELMKNFIGGSGINSKFGWDLFPPQTDPLSPEMPIILGTGPFSGTIIPGASKLSATLKFPLNGAFGTAVAGCRFPLMLKTCGYDHIIVTGKASKPVYMLISDGKVSIEEAEDLWGRDIYETTDYFLNKYEPCSVLPIGPAGENLVKISITLVDKGGTLGSGGFPALMGSKYLKAIVVRKGRIPVKVADRAKLLKLVSGLNKRIMKWPGRETILKGGLRPTQETWWGSAPLKTPMKFSSEYMDDEKKEAEFQTFLRSRRHLACPTCPIGDKECIQSKEIRGYFCQLKQDIRGGVSDPQEDFYLKVKTQYTADKLGVCLHNFSGLVTLLTALQEEGAVSKNEIGVELNGGASSNIRLLEMIAKKEGIGEILAAGFPGLIEEFGDGAKELASHNKGRYTLWDPRFSSLGTMEFGELTNPRGAHLQSGGSPSYAQGKAIKDFVNHADRMGASAEAVKRVEMEGFNPGRYTKYSEDWFSLFSSLGLCNRAFLNRFYSIGVLEGLHSALTGISLENRGLIKAAERGWNLLRMLNLREGFTATNDEAPEIWFVPFDENGNHFEITDYFGKKISKNDVGKLLRDYYDERGWDENGTPTPEKLKDLGLANLAL